eukprot:10590129-Alexandrium_andersonii.AAC.1
MHALPSKRCHACVAMHALPCMRCHACPAMHSLPSECCKRGGSHGVCRLSVEARRARYVCMRLSEAKSV